MSKEKNPLIEQRMTAAAANRKWKQHISAIAREYTKDAVETLVEIMGDNQAPPSARVKAATEILDRGWGKAPVNITLNAGGELDLEALSDKVLGDIIAENLAAMEGEQVDLDEDEYTSYFTNSDMRNVN